ncbi:MAG: hypothetical protein R2838_08775 [Caldilineaceae bacterium]
MRRQALDLFRGPFMDGFDFAGLPAWETWHLAQQNCGVKGERSFRPSDRRSVCGGALRSGCDLCPAMGEPRLGWKRRTAI